MIDFPVKDEETGVEAVNGLHTSVCVFSPSLSGARFNVLPTVEVVWETETRHRRPKHMPEVVESE